MSPNFAVRLTVVIFQVIFLSFYHFICVLFRVWALVFVLNMELEQIVTAKQQQQQQQLCNGSRQ